ncbi:MAG TPA: ARMT1-like domain-containing protein, partial [Candidatus Atribacteria bacterium]|nr:ARMT1-like domain-containing protein [Candidatus Atribacteria bacterium]
MRAQPECFCCSIRQAQEATEIAGRDKDTIWKVSQEVCAVYARADQNWTPAYMTTLAHDVTKKIVGIEDIFYQLKREHNKAALQFYPQLKEWVKRGDNSLERAVKVAIAGNIIDLGVYREVRVEEVLEEVNHAQWGRYEFASWVEDLKNAHTLIYVGDNAGEVVFDRILLEEISPGRKVFFVVKGGPISNDALLEDAQEAGIDEVAEILATGQAEVGVVLERAPSSLQKLWKEVDMIIAKGQGNFETLSEEEGNIYFLLKAKCIPVARELQVKQGDLVLQKRKE